MVEKKYKNIVYLIAFTILATIVAQVYWNKKVYDINKQQVINQIQSSFDDSVEKYFSEIAKNDVFNLVNIRKNEENHLESPDNDLRVFINSSSDSTNNRFPKSITHFSISDSLRLGISNDSILNVDNYTTDVWLQRTGDSLPKKSIEKLLHPTFGSTERIILKEIDTSNNHEFPFLKRKIDSLGLKQFTSKILFSFIMDDLELEKIDSLLNFELKRKNINIQYGFQFIDKNPLDNKLEIEDYQLEGVPTNYLSAIANSPFIMAHSTLELRYTNATISILKKMMGSILLSLLLSGIIIGCLLFLLKIISKQKQLAEVKNDIISNITHEFKTPISTIGVAIESIKNFNVIDDKEKTKKYLDISNDQLSKLDMMVEKLLETATLDSENLELNKDEIDVSDLVQNLVDKLQLQTNEKVITYKKSEVPVLANVDVFHFENAINNIIDNAIKYGGNEIFVDLKQQESNFTIDISDSGNSLSKEHSKQIFEKFYRISKGNTHDIKGFGIGLYYCKKIIEKHRGTIQLELENKLTSFKISLPNA
jgi:two-component system phosphate regulon sensor histidine kinase PhoR